MFQLKAGPPLAEKVKTSVFFLILICLAFPVRVSAQVVINEVFPNPLGTEAGAEWVELYNTTSEVEVSLSGCTLRLDDNYDPQKVVFGTEDFIGKFKVITWEGSWLNNLGDQIKLDCGTFSDVVSYGNVAGAVVSAPEEGFSFGRSPDGTGNFYLLSSVTLGEVNSPPPTPTPEPTDEPEPTEKPTNTPVPTSTPKPTSTPTPKPTSTPKPRATSIPTAEPTEGIVLTSLNSGGSDKAGEVLAVQEEKQSKFPFIPAAFILSGVIFLGLAGYIFLRQRKKEYNLNSERQTD